MPRERFLNLPAEDRARLLDIAMSEFADHGFEKASLNEILAKAGLSKGSYYYYFDDKEDLFATAVEKATDEFLAHLSLPAPDSLTPEAFWPTVLDAIEQQAALFDASKPVHRASLLLTEAQRRSARFAPILAKCRVLWTTLIDEGQRLGCVRKDLPKDMLVRLIEANDVALDTNFLLTHSELTRATFEQHIHLVYDTLRRLLCVESPPTATNPPPPTPRRGRRG
jgi:AcrR family transcriptional regulator